MSLELQIDSGSQPSKKRKSFFHWRREERPKFAHPWSAYSPTTYLAGKAPAGIVMATKVQTLLAAQSNAPKQPARSPDVASKAVNVEKVIPAREVNRLPAPALKLVAAPVPTASATSAAEPAMPQPSKPRDENRTEEAAQPAALALVAGQSSITTARSLLPEPTGQNFQLAARLKSVDILNRPKRNVRHRSIDEAPKLRRPRTIEPPAVLRKRHKSAEIIHLHLALARAEHREAKMRKSA